MMEKCSLRLLVCGSRDYSDRRRIRAVLQEYNPTLVIHGGARGADRLAAEEADYLGITTLEFKADWDKHGRAAGPIRNKRMLTEGEPDIVAAFPLGESRGTHDMIRQAKAAGVPVDVYETD